MMRYIKLNPEATFKKGLTDDGGYDLAIMTEAYIPPLSSTLLPTGISVEIPRGYVGLLSGRSSTNTRYHGLVISGRIDHGYQGEILVNLYNCDEHFPLKINQGVAIAQMAVVPFYQGELEEVTSFDKVTKRGANGFGHTG